MMNAPALPRVPDSVIHLLRDAALEAPDLPALSFEGVRLNYAQYAGLAGALARRLGERVRPGDRVALLMQNSLDLAVATFAVHALRAQAVPLNPGYRERELAYMLEDAEPCMLLHDDSVKLDLSAVCPGLDAGAILRTGNGAGLLEMLPQACALPEDLPRHEDLATLQYTGGTTGRPKGVNILHRQIAYNIAQREAWLPTRRDSEVVLCVMPLFHVSAVSMSLYLSLHARGELVVMRRFDAARTIEAIAAHGVTLLPGAPAIFHDLLLSTAFQPEKLGSLRACFSGAAPLPRETLTRFELRAGCPIHEGYGMSEAGPCLAFNPMHRPRKPGSVGLPVPGGELQVVDLDGASRVMPPGQPGEIRVRGPHVMAGYRQAAPEAVQALREGWFYTGDVAILDDEGYLHLRGRLWRGRRAAGPGGPRLGHARARPTPGHGRPAGALRRAPGRLQSAAPHRRDGSLAAHQHRQARTQRARARGRARPEFAVTFHIKGEEHEATRSAGFATPARRRRLRRH
jgi:long-chain acyl-CoA synthetase